MAKLWEIFYHFMTNMGLNLRYRCWIMQLSGVRQDDPLSPLLFVATAELLEYIINDAWHQGNLNLPLDISFGLDYPIIQYANDTLVIMPTCNSQLLMLMDLFDRFSLSIGLNLNYNKSSIAPINIWPDVESLAIFRCKVESLPFSYLGLPM
jgi:hypothetical protein